MPQKQPFEYKIYLCYHLKMDEKIAKDLTKNTNNVPKTSLHQYLKDKGILISSIGAMLGLGSFLGIIGLISVKTLTIWPLIFVYSFIFLLVLGVVIIWSEIIYTFPPNPEIRLRLFKYILVALYILTTIIACLVYRNLSNILMPVIMFFMVGLPLVKFLEDTILFRFIIWIKKKFNNKIKILFIIIAVVISSLVTLLLYELTNFVNLFINKMVI
ncbi:MAG: hypothetical protein WAV11_01980 [Minisyncoccia bacterium]